MGGSLNISLSNGWFSIRYHLCILECMMIFFRFGTEGRYSVTTGYMMVVFSCAFLFCFAKPTFFRDA